MKWLWGMRKQTLQLLQAIVTIVLSMLIFGSIYFFLTEFILP